jgi:hypothetical protein
MEVGKVPEGLRERLGDSGALALVELLDSTGRTWSEDVLSIAADRFGRRLGEESGTLRLEMANGFAAVRQEMANGFAAVRLEMGQMRADLHDEIGQVRSEAREHMAGLRADVREELATARVDLIKWSFVFWIGQLVALSSVMALMLRAAGGR